LDTVNKSFDTSGLTWQGFNTCDDPILTVKNPKKHLEIDKLLRKTYGICPSVYKTSNDISYPVQRQFLVHILDIKYVIKMTVTTPEPKADFSREINSIFTKLQRDTLKIISELDDVNTYETEYYPAVEKTDNINFISHCVDTFETIKEYVKVQNKMSEKTMNKLKENKKEDSIHISIDVSTSIRFLQKC
jgi:hypothetical protein